MKQVIISIHSPTTHCTENKFETKLTQHNPSFTMTCLPKRQHEGPQRTAFSTPVAGGAQRVPQTARWTWIHSPCTIYRSCSESPQGLCTRRRWSRWQCWEKAFESRGCEADYIEPITAQTFTGYIWPVDFYRYPFDQFNYNLLYQ